MKTAGRHGKTTTAPSTRSKSGSGLSSAKSKTFATEAAKKRCKATVKTKKVVCRPSLSSPTRLFGQEIQVIGTSFHNTIPGTTANVPGQCPQCFKKLKLQLFPIDEVTRRGMEKNKHNPYLELTLGMQKKISSVVKHLNIKWGKSDIASGELMLLPYTTSLENLGGSRRWTLQDSSISAAEVYAAIGSPAVFQLRYGWFLNSKLVTGAVTLTSPHVEGNLQNKQSEAIYITNVNEHPCAVSVQEGSVREMNVSEEKEHQCSPSNQENCPLSTGGCTTDVHGRSVKILDNMRMSNSASLVWPDLSNISFGALLSEASRAPDANRYHPLLAQNNSALQQMAISCDSFDAAIARFRATNPPPSAQVSQPSIWDAEETCHAFPFRKSNSSKDTPASCCDASFTSCNQNDIPNFKRVDDMQDTQVLQAESDALPEATTNLELQRNADAYVEPTTEIQPESEDDPCGQLMRGLLSSTEDSSNVCNDLGKIDFSLSESLGPWVNGISTSKQMLGGDSISLSGLIASSLDAF